jgi:molybdenum cofactor cytidylyltransferase
MDMAYTKALKLMKNAEAALGFPLTTRITGGRDGGGSTLTPEGKAWLRRYEAYTKACEEANQQMFRTFFPKVGCVIMACGLGKRFGGNKLMADFRGEPMIAKALHASRSLKENRVVVTRHQDVAELCREQGVQVVLHDLPHRSDTVRLGLEALDEVDACLFLPADQPLLRPETVENMVDCWSEDREMILRPVCREIPGAPVLFPKRTFPELLNLPEGKGGGWVMKKYPQSVREFPVEDPCQLMDVDTPETLALLQQM